MLEISHQQAQFLIRQSSDDRLPEQQWHALQAHLEQCPECRAYRDRLSQLEREVRRGLQDRWAATGGPAAGLADEVTRARLARRKHRRNMLRYAGAGLLLVLLVMLGARGLRLAASPARPTMARVVIAPPTPTLPPGERFRGVVAFTSTQEGNSEIYLLNASGVGPPEVTNLTQSPSDETGPVWSADGAWLAFLSNRTGKNEVYMLSVAGSRLTQLTSEPDIDWQPPLAWSPDGRWLALVGWRRALNDQPWVYLLPLNNADPRSAAPRVLPGTKGVTGPLHFFQSSPSQGDPASVPALSANSAFKGLDGLFLTYPSPKDGSVVMRYALQAGVTRPLALDENDPSGVKTDLYAGFATYRSGYLEETIYLTEDRPGSGSGGQRIRRLLVDLVNGGQTNDTITGAPEKGSIRDLLVIPEDLRIAYLQQTGGAGCWALTLRNDRPGDTQRRQFDQLCVEGALDAAQWQSGARWAVLPARAPGDPATALYALRMPPTGDMMGPMTIERLTGLDASSTGVSVRPEGADLKLQPRAYPIIGGPLPPAVPPASLPGKLLLVVPDAAGGRNSAIWTADPGAPGYSVVVPADAYNRCPALSPDGRQVAFVSDRADRPDGGSTIVLDPRTGKVLPRREGLFLVSTEGGKIIQLGWPFNANNGQLPPIYDCPVWSPDGKYVASILRSSLGIGLTVNATNGDLVRYISTGLAARFAGLAFTPDGQSILVAESASNGRAPAIVSYSWLDNWRTPDPGKTLFTLSGWDDVLGLSLSPDGHQLALILLRKATPDRAALVNLRVYSLDPYRLAYQHELPAYEPAAQTNPGRIFWLPDGSLAFAIPGAPLARFKATLVRYSYSPRNDTTQFLAYLEDTFYDWAVNDNWLIYSSESGLWGKPVNGRFDQPSAPFHLGDTVVSSISWR